MRYAGVGSPAPCLSLHTALHLTYSGAAGQCTVKVPSVVAAASLIECHEDVTLTTTRLEAGVLLALKGCQLGVQAVQQGAAKQGGHHCTACNTLKLVTWSQDASVNW